MKIKVIYLGYVRNLTKKSQETFEVKENITIGELLNVISRKYGSPFQHEIYEPEQEKLKHEYGVIINGFLMNRLQGLKTILKNGDKVFLTTLISGG